MRTSTIRSVSVACVLGLSLPHGACWRIGEPTDSDAVVAWAAFPDTVIANQVFPFEFAGPITPDACGRLDTAMVAIADSSIELSARRTTYETMCADTPIGFYEVRALELPAGVYVVRAGPRVLGHIVSLEEGAFAPMRTSGVGMVDRAGGCLLFGPGQLGNQRPFVLRGRGLDAPEVERAIGTRRLLDVRGTLSGFTLCGDFGSRPVIRVSRVRVLDRTADDYYEK